MTELPDYMRLNESEQCLLGYVKNQLFDLGACPACGSLFVLHICHANPSKGKGKELAKAKARPIKGLRADRVIIDEIDGFIHPAERKWD